MEYDDIEFKEGVHKSVRRVSWRETEVGSKGEPVAADEAIAANEAAPGPASAPVAERKRSRYGRWLQIVAALLLVCIVGGGVLVFQRLHTIQKQPARTTANRGTFCATTGAPVNMNVGAPSLNSVAALSQKDVWTVGNLANQTLTEHWDGTGWRFIPSPNGQIVTIGANSQSLNTGSRLESVATISANDAWAVGTVDFSQVYVSQVGVGLHTLIEHWDGSQWNIVPSPDGAQFKIVSPNDPNGTLLQGRNELSGIAAVSANDIWAVGSADNSKFYTYNAYQNNATYPLIEHWDGNAWKIVPVPNLPPNAILNAVTAIASNNVWAVGLTLKGQNASTLIAHWDGNQWSVAPNAGANGGELTSISASSANDIWATGFGTIEHWDGTNWNPVSYPIAPSNGEYNIFSSVLALAANNVWLAGIQQTSSGSNNTQDLVLLEHWDGHQWKSAPQAQAIHGNLTAITATGGQVWSVGTSIVALQEIQNSLIETNCS